MCHDVLCNAFTRLWDTLRHKGQEGDKLTQSKIGYQVHNVMTYGRGWSADETTYFWQHLERLQPAAMLFLDDDGKAKECKRRFPDCAVVVRNWTGTEGDLHKVMTPQEVFNKYKDTPGDLIRNIGNEPSGYDNPDTSWNELNQLAQWYAEVMDLFGKALIRIIVPNFGEGHPHETELDALEPLWKAFDKWHDTHYYGCHEYGTWRGMLYNEPGTHDVYPWRVGRFEMFIVPYLQQHGHKVPQTIVTEWGVDSAHDGTNKRGWRDSMTEERYAQELSAALEKVYTAPHYVGLCIFTWGNSGKQGTGDDWVTFDVSGAKTLHTELEKLALPTAPPPAETPEPPPIVDVPPHPGMPVEMTNTFHLAILIRNTPAGDYSGNTIPPGAKYTYYPQTETENDTHTWYYVEVGTTARGWARKDAMGLDDTPDVPQEPAPDVAALVKRLEAVEFKQGVYDEKLALLNKKLDVMITTAIEIAEILSKLGKE